MKITTRPGGRLAAVFLCLGLVATAARGYVADAVAGFAHVQFIHNAPDVGPLDVYLDGVKIYDDLRFRTATPFIRGVVTGERRLDLTAPDASDNMAFGEVSDYLSLVPVGHNIQITDEAGAVSYEVFRLDLFFYRGRTLVLMMSGAGTSAREGVILIGFDVSGRGIFTRVTAAMATGTTVRAGRMTLAR